MEQLSFTELLHHNPRRKGGWNHYGVFPEIPCVTCGTIFKPGSGAAKYCSKQCGLTKGKLSTKAQYERISGDWRAYLRRLINTHGRKKDGLTVEDLLSVLEKQGYACALSGEPLTCKLEQGVKFDTNASVDRIIAGGPYVPENIQLVCKAVNGFRGDTPIEDFVNWCEKVARNAER